jgi:hypothetical protein
VALRRDRRSGVVHGQPGAGPRRSGGSRPT